MPLTGWWGQCNYKIMRFKNPFYTSCILISVRLWNLKDGGSLEASFLAKNQHATKGKSLKNSFESLPLYKKCQNCKGMFLSEDTDVFVTTPNRRTFFFPEIENLNFGD